MHTTSNARGPALAIVLSLTVALWACDSPPQSPTAPDALLIGAAAKGGNGNGKGNGGGDPPLNLIELSGAVETFEGPQDAGPGSRSKNRREIASRGPAADECDDPSDTTTATGRCFRGELDFTGQLSACQGPNVNAVVALLQDGLTKARWYFSADISIRHDTALLRVFWYESGDPDRYSLLVHVADAQETSNGSDVWELKDGQVSVSHHDPNGPVTCDWAGQIDLTITPDTN